MDNSNKNKKLTPEEEQIMNERMLERRKLRAEQQEKTQIKKQKRVNKVVKLRTLAVVFLSVVVILSLLFIAARSLGNVTFSKAADYISQSISNIKPGDGYPIELGAGKVLDLKSFGDAVAVLKDDGVLVLNSTAKELSDYTHSYSKPVMAVNAGRILVTDRTTGRYFIADGHDMLFESQLQSEVYCAEIGCKGNYAFSCSDSDAASVLKVFNSEFESELSFKCSGEYIIDISLSKNGKYIAAIAVGSENATIYSKLYLINIDNQKVVNEFDFKNETFCRVFYSSNNSVIAVSNNAYYVVNNDEELNKFNFDNNTVSFFLTDADSGNFAFVLTKYGSIDSSVITVYDSKGREKYSIDVNSNIESIAYNSKNISFVNSSNVLFSYNSSGTLIGKNQLENNAQKLALNGKYSYSLCYGDLLRKNLKTDLSEDK